MNEDIIEFTAYLMENCRRIKKMNGREIAEFFEKNNVFEFVQKHYDFLHTESSEANVKTIDEFIKTR